jgi:NCAIR mutase (PurE)-related protein
MNMDQTLLAVLSFGVGYAIGSLDNIRRSLKGSDSTSFVSEVVREQKQQQSRKKISIDEAKYVTDISTDDLESKGGKIGVVSQTNDDISSAANKLAQLKKMKG